MTDSQYDRGMQIRREVLGDAHVERAQADSTEFDQDFQRFITESAWGTAWAREGLDRKTRHMVTIGIIAALGKEHELKLHLNATPNTGVRPEEVREVFHQLAIYGGVPAANRAFSIGKQVFSGEGKFSEEVAGK
jgi:4-carboxymuconolactone decarboxylase